TLGEREASKGYDRVTSGSLEPGTGVTGPLLIRVHLEFVQRLAETLSWKRAGTHLARPFGVDTIHGTERAQAADFSYRGLLGRVRFQMLAVVCEPQAVGEIAHPLAIAALVVERIARPFADGLALPHGLPRS